jgi:hypothetical protein
MTRARILTLAALAVPVVALAKPYMDRSTSRPSGTSGVEGTIDLREINDANGAYALRGQSAGTLTRGPATSADSPASSPDEMRRDRSRRS